MKEYDDLVKINPAPSIVNNYVDVWEITKSKQRKSYFPTVKTNSFIVIKQGEIEFSLNGNKYRVKKNSLVIIMALYDPMLISATDNIIAYGISFSKTLGEDAIPRKRMISFPHMKNLLGNPLISLANRETDLLIGNIKRIQRALARNTHIFRDEIIRNEFSNLLMELENIVVNMQEEKPTEQPLISRKENILIHFAVLVVNNFKEEHGVSFYAQKLCISPQYLARIVKELSGKTVYEWISEKLLSAAKLSLKNSDLSVQQIADDLHFSDQASFGKFFKKHVGIAPMQYRKTR